MITSRGDRLTVALLFALIGLPPGLCSILETSSVLTLARDPSPETSFYAPLLEVAWLIGIVTFGAMPALLLITWTRKS